MRFRGGIVFKAHRLLYHSTLGWRVMKKKRKLPVLYALSSIDSGVVFRVEVQGAGLGLGVTVRTGSGTGPPRDGKGSKGRN